MNTKRLFLALTTLLFLANSARSFNVDGLEYVLIDGNSAVQIVEDLDYASMESLTIPDYVTYEGESYPVRSVGVNAFGGCINIKNVSFGSKLNDILWYAFMNCESLREVNIPDNVTLIDYAAFLGCSNLEKVTIGKSVNKIFLNSFMNCPVKHLVWNAKSVSTFSVNNDGTPDPDPLAGPWCSAPEIEILEFGSEVESIPIMIAAESKIERITIPHSVKSIHFNAFLNCSLLKEVKVENEDPSDIEMYEGVFEGVDKNECVLIVPKGSAELYRQADQWKDFVNIQEAVDSSEINYDLNGDGLVDVDDVNALIKYILSK